MYLYLSLYFSTQGWNLQHQQEIAVEELQKYVVWPVLFFAYLPVGILTLQGRCSTSCCQGQVTEFTLKLAWSKFGFLKKGQKE